MKIKISELMSDVWPSDTKEACGDRTRGNGFRLREGK